MKILLYFFRYFRWFYLAFFIVCFATIINDNTSHYRIFMEYKIPIDSPRNRAFVDSIANNNIDHLDITFANNKQMHLYTREENGDLYLVPNQIIGYTCPNTGLFDTIGLQTIKDYVYCYKFEEEQLSHIVEYKKIVYYPFEMDLYMRYFFCNIYSLIIMHLLVVLNFYFYKRINSSLQDS